MNIALGVVLQRIQQLVQQRRVEARQGRLELQGTLGVRWSRWSYRAELQEAGQGPGGALRRSWQRQAQGRGTGSMLTSKIGRDREKVGEGTKDIIREAAASGLGDGPTTLTSCSRWYPLEGQQEPRGQDLARWQMRLGGMSPSIRSTILEALVNKK